MKLKVLLFCVVASSAFALTSFTAEIKNVDNEKPAACKYGQCSYTKRDGFQCNNCSQEGSFYCWSHRDK
jgi:hypothetical protein